MNYFDNLETFTDDENISFSGINFNIVNLHLYKNFYSSYIINEKEQYRPDIIAFNLYGDDNLSWIIDEINSVTHPSFYEYGKKIKYLSYGFLMDMGLI